MLGVYMAQHANTGEIRFRVPKLEEIREQVRGSLEQQITVRDLSETIAVGAIVGFFTKGAPGWRRTLAFVATNEFARYLKGRWSSLTFDLSDMDLFSGGLGRPVLSEENRGKSEQDLVDEAVRHLAKTTSWAYVIGMVNSDDPEVLKELYQLIDGWDSKTGPAFNLPTRDHEYAMARYAHQRSRQLRAELDKQARVEDKARAADSGWPEADEEIRQARGVKA